MSITYDKLIKQAFKECGVEKDRGLTCIYDRFITLNLLFLRIVYDEKIPAEFLENMLTLEDSGLEYKLTQEYSESSSDGRMPAKGIFYNENFYKEHLKKIDEQIKKLKNAIEAVKKLMEYISKKLNEKNETNETNESILSLIYGGVNGGIFIRKEKFKDELIKLKGSITFFKKHINTRGRFIDINRWQENFILLSEIFIELYAMLNYFEIGKFHYNQKFISLITSEHIDKNKVIRDYDMKNKEDFIELLKKSYSDGLIFLSKDPKNFSRLKTLYRRILQKENETNLKKFVSEDEEFLFEELTPQDEELTPEDVPPPSYHKIVGTSYAGGRGGKIKHKSRKHKSRKPKSRKHKSRKPKSRKHK